jgi:hypothetical protein
MTAMTVHDRRRVVKVLVAWTVGVVMEGGAAAVSLAKPVANAGKHYCFCHCTTTYQGQANYGRQMTWEKKASCNVNGTKCTLEKERVSGTLSACGECVVAPEGGCRTVMAPPHSSPFHVPPGSFSPQ